jgi:conjugative relaxase-like TrwC/TraI family protein
MLSLGKLAPGQQQYYLDTVARGVEEYYTGAKEAPGEWIGKSASHLALIGEVDELSLGRILEQRNPWTGERLTRAQGAPKVPGFDATFCAPKSVSLFFALGDPEISNEVRNAHDAAVKAALGVLEAEAALARRGRGGIEQHVTEGFVAAAFRHRTSRAGDPHLHTHVLVANLVYAPHDGRWSALDARGLYGWAKTVGYLYEAQLRAELTRRLGVQWGPVTNGIADLDGIPQPVLRSFSRRRQEIEMHMEEHGESGARAAQIATYATRKAKYVEVAAESLMPEWRDRARSLGLDDHALAAVTGRAAYRRPAPSPGTLQAESLFRHLANPTGLTAHASSFGRREVLQAISTALAWGGNVEEVVNLADAFLASRHVVPLGASSGLRSSDVIRRADGTVVATHADEQRWTTPKMLAVERHLIQRAVSRRHDGVGITDPHHVSAAIRTHPSLSREQVHMLKQITRCGAGVDVVEGAAGTGKTYALLAAREAWQASGHRVIGCALAARAAAHLEQGTGIPSVTLDRLLGHFDRHESSALDARTVIVVDEAAMVGTRKLARLLDHAHAARAKVVLVGDHYQLPEIDAGGAFAGLATRLRGTQLNENRRQVERWERAALTDLRTGNPHAAFDTYRDHGRVHHDPDPERLRERLVDDWWGARTRAPDSIMIATRRADVDDLNRRARHRLAAAGHLGPDEIILAGRAFSIGDDILATRNAYPLGVLNGTRATVTAIDHNTGAIHARAGQRELVIPHSYAEAGYLTHAYAMTFHKAQGMTVHEAFVLADDTLDRQRGYTGLSRGTHRNSLYIAEPADQRSEERHAPELLSDTVARAREAMARILSKSMAADRPERSRSPATPPTPAVPSRQPPAQDLGPALGL